MCHDTDDIIHLNTQVGTEGVALFQILSGEPCKRFSVEDV